MKDESLKFSLPDSKYICEYCECALLRYRYNYPPEVGDLFISEVDLKIENFEPLVIEGRVVCAQEVDADCSDSGVGEGQYFFEIEFSKYVNASFAARYLEQNSDGSLIDAKYLNEFPMVLRFREVFHNVWEMIISVKVCTNINSFLAPIPGYIPKEAARIRMEQMRSPEIKGAATMKNILGPEEICELNKAFDNLQKISEDCNLYYDRLNRIAFLNQLIASEDGHLEDECPEFNYWRQRYIRGAPTFFPLRVKCSEEYGHGSRISISEKFLTQSFFSKNLIVEVLEKLMPMFELVVGASNNKMIPGFWNKSAVEYSRESLLSREYIDFVIGFRDEKFLQGETATDHWKTQGIANANILAAGIFVLNNLNIFGGDLEFRRFIQEDEDGLVTGNLSNNDVIQFDTYENIDVIPVGTYQLVENSAIVFPGSFISKFTDMMPKDKGGARLRLIYIWLIDPNKRNRLEDGNQVSGLALSRDDSLILSQTAEYYDCGSVMLPYLYC